MYCAGPGWLCMGCGWPELARLATHSFCRGNSVQLGAVQFDSVQLGSVQFGSTQFNSVQLGSIRFNSHRRPHVSSAVHVDLLRPANNQPTLPGVSRYFPAVPWLSPGVSQRPQCPPGCLPASRMSPGCLPNVSRPPRCLPACLGSSCSYLIGRLLSNNRFVSGSTRMVVTFACLL